jgi:hypothetical protein
MKQLNPHDLSWAVRILPREVKALMQEHGQDIILGGGFLRSAVQGERPNDVDLFVPSADLARVFAVKLSQNGNRRIIETENAYSLRNVGGHFVQFVHKWTYTEPEALIESFDFTIACAAIWFADCKWNSLRDPDYYSDLAAKRLVYRRPIRNEAAGGSFLRAVKFWSRGFRSPLDTMGALISRLNEGVDREKLSGVRNERGFSSEEAYAFVVTGLLVEVDPAADPEHAAHLPSLKEEDNASV